MQSGPGTNSASFRQLPSPSQLEHRAADVPAVKPEEASAQPDGAVGQVIEGAGQLSEVARQLPVPLMQQVPGGDGLEAAAAAANKLATSMAPVSVRHALLSACSQYASLDGRLHEAGPSLQHMPANHNSIQ